MLINAKESLWTPYQTFGHYRRMSHPSCYFFKRYDLLCATPRQQCVHCGIRQYWLNEVQNARQGDKDRGIHICDVCGLQIGKVDTIKTVDIIDRNGLKIASYDLCIRCANKLATWIGGDKPNIGKTDDDEE